MKEPIKRVKKRPQIPTATVSICVSHDESERIRNAAAAAGLTVSTWAATRVTQAMANPTTRLAVRTVADELHRTLTPRGARRERISMVMREVDRDSLRTITKGMNMAPHAFVQAAMLGSADKELGVLPSPQLRMIEAARKDAQRAGTMLVTLPRALADGLDIEALSGLVRALVTGTRAQVVGGHATKIAEGCQRLAQAHSEVPTVTIKLHANEFEVRAVAFVLDVQPAVLASALAIKAARQLGASQ